MIGTMIQQGPEGLSVCLPDVQGLPTCPDSSNSPPTVCLESNLIRSLCPHKTCLILTRQVQALFRAGTRLTAEHMLLNNSTRQQEYVQLCSVHFSLTVDHTSITLTYISWQVKLDIAY